MKENLVKIFEDDSRQVCLRGKILDKEALHFRLYSGVKFSLEILDLLDKNTEHKAVFIVELAGENIQCNIKSLAVLDEDSRRNVVILGKVREGSANSFLCEEEEVFFLSPHAKNRSMPAIQSHCAEANCKHTLHNNSFDADSLNFLKTRGLSQIAAQKLLLKNKVSPDLQRRLFKFLEEASPD